jgi:hypothetical protein
VRSHWNTDEFAEQVIVPRAHSHATECDECRIEVEEFRRELAAFRDDVHSAAQRPSFFWAAQRNAIGARLRKASTWQGLRFALVSALALFAVAASLLVPGAKQQQLVAGNAHATVDQDELLMRQVDEALLSNVPDSLEPANLIASDLGNALSKAQQNLKK